MKKILLVYAVLIIAVVLLAVMRGNFSFSLNPFASKSTVTINKTKFNATVAKNDKDRISGLSGKASLDQNSGMLFVFDKKDKYAFWMKDMKFPIDIIYIDTDKVVDIIENAQVPDSKNLALASIYRPKSPANYVFEINAGLVKKNNIKVGDKVVIK